MNKVNYDYKRSESNSDCSHDEYFKRNGVIVKSQEIEEFEQSFDNYLESHVGHITHTDLDVMYELLMEEEAKVDTDENIEIIVHDIGSFYETLLTEGFTYVIGNQDEGKYPTMHTACTYEEAEKLISKYDGIENDFGQKMYFELKEIVYNL